MSRIRLLPIAALAALGLALPAGASAAPPEIGKPTVIKAGERTPVTIPGGNLRRGEKVPRGKQILRWRVQLHGKSNKRFVLRAPKGYVHAGLALLQRSKVSFRVAGAGREYFTPRIHVQFYPGQKGDWNSRGSVFALVQRGR